MTLSLGIGCDRGSSLGGCGCRPAAWSRGRWSGADGRAVEVIDEFLGWLTGIERSPNTVEAYARDLGLFWSFLGGRGLAWDRVSVVELGEFAAWARRPAENVLVLSEQAAQAVGVDGEPDARGGGVVLRVPRPARE